MNNIVESEATIARSAHLAAGLSLAAGMVHLVVSPGYLSEWWGYGFFFMIIGLAQITAGLVLFLQPWLWVDHGAVRAGQWAGLPAFYRAGVVVNVAIIALFVLSRTLGIPLFGPEAGSVEPVTMIGLVTMLIEVALVVSLLRLVRRTG